MSRQVRGGVNRAEYQPVEVSKKPRAPRPFEGGAEWRLDSQKDTNLVYRETKNSRAELRPLSADERDEEYEVLKKQNEDAEEFMAYLQERDPERLEELALEDLSDLADDEQADEQADFGFGQVSNLFKRALVFSSANNKLEDHGSKARDLSFDSLSELPIDAFLARKRDPRPKEHLRCVEKTPAVTAQMNYSHVWYQEAEDTLEQADQPGPIVVLLNREAFPWTAKPVRYFEWVELTKAEKDRVKPFQKPRAQVLLDPKIHEILEQLNNFLKKLQKRGIGLKEFLHHLSRMHVALLHPEPLRGELQQAARLLQRAPVRQRAALHQEQEPAHFHRHSLRRDPPARAREPGRAAGQGKLR